MTAIASDIPAQEAAPISLTMEVEEDIEQEIESFVRFKRRGEYEQAEEVFQETLSKHLSLFPVIAEYADFLLVQEKYRILSEFLDIQMQYMESVFKEEEMELLRIVKSLVNVYTKGLLRPALVQAKHTWGFLARRSMSMPPDTLPVDVEIHIFEIYIKIIIFAWGTSNWVGPHEMKCPWAPGQDSDHCGFVLWYLVLSSKGHLWSASQVLLSLLEALPSLQEYDAMALFDNHCFGKIASKESLDNLNEMDQLIACSVSFGRAQALLNLALSLYQLKSGDLRWKELYALAYRYNRIADRLPSIIHNDDVVSVVDLRAYTQRTQFERVKEELIGPKISAPPPRGIAAFRRFTDALLQQDPRCYYICYFQSAYYYARGLTNRPPSPLSLIELQLHDQGNLIGFIRTCDLFSTLMTNLLRGQERRYFRPFLSSEADSFLALQPFSAPQKTARVTKAISDLVIQLSNQLQHVFRKTTLEVVLGQSAHAGSFSEEKSATFGIPSYLWALPKIRERFEFRLQEVSKLTANPASRDFLQESGETFFLKPVNRDRLSLIARLVLAESQSPVRAEKNANHGQDTETWQARKSELDPTPTQARLEPASKEAVELHETIVQRHESKQPGLLDDNESAKKTFSVQRVPFVSHLMSESPVQSQAKAVKESFIPSHDEPSSSYASICNELRADLTKDLQLRDDHARRFAAQGTAKRVLRGDKLLQFFRSLHLQDNVCQDLDRQPEEIFAKILAEKNLYDFLAILIFSMCDIEAARKFTTKIMAAESSWSWGNLKVPTSQGILDALFGDRTVTDQFLAHQAIFCPAVIRQGREVVIPSLDIQRLPYLEEDLISQGSCVKVYKVKIAEGHFFGPIRGGSNQYPMDVVRKDYIMSGGFGKWLSSANHDIMNSILSLKKDCKNVAESFGSLAIGSWTYSLFVPLARFNLEQYMMGRYDAPFTFIERVDFVHNTLGLTMGLCYLHTELKSETGTSFICYDFGLKPENVLLFEEYDKDGGRYRWKLSDFGMAHVKYRKQGQLQYTTVRNIILQRYSRPLQSRSQDSLLLRPTDRRYEDTYLPPESMGVIPAMDTRSDVWSLGCIVSVVFTFVLEGPDGVTKYAENRATHKKADGFDRFFLCDKDSSRPKTLHPAVKAWHRRLISHAKSRSRGEGKAVEFILRFLESAVFTKQSARCDAHIVKQKLLETWGKYLNGEESWYQGRIARVDRFLQLPQTMIRRIVTHGEGHKEREGQEEQPNELGQLGSRPLQQLMLDSRLDETYSTLGELDEMHTSPGMGATTTWLFRDTP